MNKNNLITGIPRSGTSLFSSLIADNLNTVVFSEPEWLKFVRKTSENSHEFTLQLLNHISKLRNDIKQEIPLKLKINKKNHKLPSNYYVRDNIGKVTILKKEEEVLFKKNYSGRPFYIKSNAQFTSCLQELIQSNEFKIYCIIRNPVSCIMSWRSLKIPVSHGNMKIAEKYSSTYTNFIAESKDLLHKQVLIIDWFYREFYKHSNSVEIIKYENLLKKPHRIISKITKNDNPIINNLVSGNNNIHYDHNERQKIHDCLIKYGTYYKYFYENLDSYSLNRNSKFSRKVIHGKDY